MNKKEHIIAVQVADDTVYSDPEATIHAEVIDKHDLFYDDIASKGWVDPDGHYHWAEVIG